MSHAFPLNRQIEGLHPAVEFGALLLQPIERLTARNLPCLSHFRRKVENQREVGDEARAPPAG